MRLRWLVAGLLLVIVASPLLVGPRGDDRRASATRTAPARRHEPMPVEPTLPNAYRVNPVPRPLQA